MTKILSLLVAITFLAVGPFAGSAPQAPEKPKEADSKPAPEAPPKEESSVTEHSIRIAGQTISYKATAGTILLKDEKSEPTASIYYTGYTRSDVKDLSQRSLAFLY